MRSLGNYFAKDKIFVIGFNRTGTTTLHRFFRRNYIRSVQWHYDNRFVAIVMSRNIARGVDILNGIERFSAFSDLCFFTYDIWLEGNKYFREMHRAYPSAYFIFNDRPVENWIASRARFSNLLTRAETYHRAKPEQVKDIWRADYALHKQEVLDYFKDSDRFLHFNIEADMADKVVAFLAPSFYLDTTRYRHAKKSSCSGNGNQALPEL